MTEENVETRTEETSEVDLEEIIGEAFVQPGESGSDYLSKEQASKVVRKERERASKKKERELSEALGVTIDEAKAIIKNHREREAADKSEVQRLSDEAQQKDSRIAAMRSEIDTMRRSSALERAFRGAGINEARLDLAIRLADSSSLAIDDSGKVSGVNAAVKEIKEASPEWFVSATPPEAPRTPRIGPAPTPEAADSRRVTEAQEESARREAYSAVQSAF